MAVSRSSAVGELEGRDAEDAAARGGLGLVDGALVDLAELVGAEGGEDEASVVAQTGEDEGLLGVLFGMDAGERLGEEAAAQGERGGFAQGLGLGAVEGLLDEQHREGEVADLVEADDVDGLGDRGDGVAERVVAEGIGGLDHLGGDHGVAADEVGQFLDGDREGAVGELLDELDDLGQAGRLVGAEGLLDAGDGLTGER